MIESRDYTEFEERLRNISAKIDKAEILYESLSINRKKYREFANEIDIDFSVLETAFNFYDSSLLIDIYTFCEQLLKKFIYNVLDAENDDLDNKHVYKFINAKLSKEKFAPDGKIEKINEHFKNYIYMEGYGIKKISLIKIPSYDIQFNSYDKLIKHRHNYAHTGNNSGFDLELIKDGFKVAEFILNEVINITNYFSDRIKLQKIIDDIKNMQKQLEEKPENYKSKRAINEKAKRIRKQSISGKNIIENMIVVSNVMEELKKSLKELSKMDLRHKKDSTLAHIMKYKL